MRNKNVIVLLPTIMGIGGVIAQLIISIFTGTLNTDHIGALICVWGTVQIAVLIYAIKKKI